MHNRMETIMAENIDIVITWVDNKDPHWIKDYQTYLDENAANEAVGKQRFEDIESLQYIFRGIEKFLPWIRKVHLVTSGHKPDWLNSNHPKLQLVTHGQIFPKNALPTFNACSIEMCFANIPDLAEQFIYFNDDMFVVQPLAEKRFFERGIPKDFLAFEMLFHDGIFSHILHSDMQIINKEIRNKNQFIKNNFFKIFNYKYGLKRMIKNLLLLPFPSISLFELYYHPQPFLKKNIIDIIEKYPSEVKITRASKFKRATDLNQYLFRFKHLIKGEFIPYNPKDTLFVGIQKIDDLKEGIDILKKNKHITMVCFNEKSEFDPKDYDEYKIRIRNYLESILPDKSTFEK